MMFTYSILNLFFLVTLVLFLPRRLHAPSRAWWLTLIGVVALTLLFDPIIVALSIVDYDATKLLGIRFFGMPVEDLFYALYAVCIVPLIWHKLGGSPRENA